MDGYGTLPVWTLADCTGDVRRAIIAWKDRGRADLTPVLAAALARASAQVASGLAVPTGPTGSTGSSESVAVVAAPSTAASRRRRGGNLVDALAAAAATGLRAGGWPADPAPVLVRSRGGDQVGLGARARARNLAGHVHVAERRAELVRGRSVVLVDDVLTTGATFAACRTAVERAGGRVVAALTLASTPGPGRPPALPPRRPDGVG
jgi:predicted amidophosphoribosyltransferase